MYGWDLLFGGLSLTSSRHGSPAWSAVVLLRGRGDTILLDTGGPQYRTPMLSRLAELGVRPEEVTGVALSHCHWDHMSNLPMFPNATVFVSDTDLTWAASCVRGDPAVPELHVADLLELERHGGQPVVRMADGFAISPGLRAVATPGHTPGHMSFAADTDQGPIVFAGDAAKDERELVTGTAAMTMDAAASRRSIDRLVRLCEQRGGVLVCGHDGLFRIRAGAVGRVRTEPEVVTGAAGTLDVGQPWTATR